jgi:hypothetical protein
MSRFINTHEPRNLWGRAADEGGLEPQRNDLWLVDMKNVISGLNRQGIFETLGLAPVTVFLPQYAQSVSLPDLKIKPEVVRRDSVPFQMPSWDEPLEPLKVVFLVDSTTSANGSRVLSVLQAWQALVRVGRGTRTGLYDTQTAGELDPWIPLKGPDYEFNYAFPVAIHLLGGFTGVGAATTSAAAQEAAAQVWAGNMEWASSSAASQLTLVSSWYLKNVWIGGWKLGDLSYAESKLLTVEATLYAESFS